MPAPARASRTTGPPAAQVVELARRSARRRPGRSAAGVLARGTCRGSGRGGGTARTARGVSGLDRRRPGTSPGQRQALGVDQLDLAGGGAQRRRRAASSVTGLPGSLKPRRAAPARRWPAARGRPAPRGVGQCWGTGGVGTAVILPLGGWLPCAPCLLPPSRRRDRPLRVRGGPPLRLRGRARPATAARRWSVGDVDGAGAAALVQQADPGAGHGPARARPAAGPAGPGLRLPLRRALPRRRAYAGSWRSAGPRRVRAADAAGLPARRRGPRAGDPRRRRARRRC